MMVLPGIGHLTFQREEFLAQVPRWLPSDPAFMDFVVLASGVVEIALGLALIFLSRYKVIVGFALATFFVLIFPGNISQYTNGIDGFGLDTDAKRLTRLFFQPVLILWALWSSGALAFLKMKRKERKEAQNQKFADFKASDISGKPVEMRSFLGKVVIVVNTASKCGLTPQYEGLETLYKKYKSDGLVILGFPCNQFADQEKGSDEEISEFCEVNYGVSFPMFSKIDVNGPSAHPLFVFLKAKLGVFPLNEVKWNFTKFVIDRDGKPAKRFAPTTAPQKMEAYICNLLDIDPK